MSAAEKLPAELPALTVWQPWAEMICLGLKPIEFRPWCAPPQFHFRQIAIHVGVRKLPDRQMRAETYHVTRDRGLAMCGRRLDDHDLEEVLSLFRRARTLPHGAFIGTCMLGKPVLCSDMFGGVKVGLGRFIDPNMWAWPVSQGRQRPAIPGRGQQGFFTMAVPPEWRETADVV